MNKINSKGVNVKPFTYGLNVKPLAEIQAIITYMHIVTGEGRKE
jgi:hypothetical protein